MQCMRNLYLTLTNPIVFTKKIPYSLPMSQRKKNHRNEGRQEHRMRQKQYSSFYDSTILLLLWTVSFTLQYYLYFLFQLISSTTFAVHYSQQVNAVVLKDIYICARNDITLKTYILNNYFYLDLVIPVHLYLIVLSLQL